MSESLFYYEEDSLKSYPTYKYDENMKKKKKRSKKTFGSMEIKL